MLQTLAFTLLHELTQLSYWPAYLAALVLSVLYNFTVNRRYTFRSAANIPVAMAKVGLYYCVFTPLSTWWGQALAQAGWNEYLILFITMAVNLTTEFLFCRYVVYRGTLDSRPAGPAEKGEEG